VSTLAKANSGKFYIGIDANAKPLEKPSMKATRKPAKGGLPNAMFVQAAVEDLPGELEGVANEIQIHFPWGSLLRAVAYGDEKILAGLRRICAEGSVLKIIIGIDEERDRAEVARLGIEQLSDEFISKSLAARYRAAGFALVEFGKIGSDEWASIETSWARRLSGNDSRRVTFLIFRAE
jgi:16S rRNA (adenine(1408)-N(1))-methyltransferase